MYPIVRLIKEMTVHRNDPPLALGEVHVSHHICWPWDLDPWMELNNGRTLTLYDLGRIPFVRRMGLIGMLRDRGWGMAVAGASVRYRRRVTAFQRLEMRSRALGWDDRFLYLEQAMFTQGGEAASHVLLRSAITRRGKGGIIPPADLDRALGGDGHSPALPDWVLAWAKADAARPWPPLEDAIAPR